MNKTFEKIYSENNAILDKDMVLKENTALFEKVYAEAEMLNEMNPKLRALLAAGLIGTAGLGATSCSTPNDDYEEPTVIEQPATPETPGSTTETPAEPETPSETGDTKETADMEVFKVHGLEVTPKEAECLSKTRKMTKLKNSIKDVIGYTDLMYKDGFIPVSFKNNIYEDGQTYVCYVDTLNKVMFNVPVEMEDAFDSAIAAYNAIHNK